MRHMSIAWIFPRYTRAQEVRVIYNPLVLLVVDAFLDQRFYDVQLTTGFFIKHYRHCFRDRATAELRRVWDEMAQQFDVKSGV